MKMLLKLFSYFYLQIYTFIKRINNKYTPSWIILFIDTYLTIQSFFLAYIVINGFKFNYNFLKALFIVKLVSLFSFLLIGSYKGLIRHTGSKDAYNVFIALILVAIILSSLNFIDLYVLSKTYFQIPFSVIIIHFLLSTVILILSRFAFKWLFNSIISKFKSTSNILIYGAGDSGLLTYYAINEDKQNQLKVIGFIDDHKGKIGKKINQVKIYAPSQITKNFIIKNNIKEVIVSIQNINSEKLTSLVEKSLSKSLKVKIVPAVSNWINGSLKVRQIKDIKIEDLLGRKLINIENSLLKKEFSEKIILITGAAGSIGSEIARQIAVYNYHTLILLDQAESPSI
jgi:FlaA1/EpsC-like NDP-sugar epimerase